MYAQNILVLVPHPDDEVVGCAMAIDAARRQGCRVHAAYLTTGVPPREVMWSWQRGAHHDRQLQTRRHEMNTVAGELGLNVALCTDIPSRHLRYHITSTISQLDDIVELNRIDMLWVPAYEGGHQDHDVANFVGAMLKARVAVWEFSEYHFAHARVTTHRFVTPGGGERVLTLPPHAVSRKRRLLGLYESEQKNLRHIATRQEVFRPLARYDYNRPPHGGRLFYQRHQWVPWHPRVDATQPEEVCRAMRAYVATRPLEVVPRLRAV
jgi:LmbE family N-acetylglucosaminyl deacetylase